MVRCHPNALTQFSVKIAYSRLVSNQSNVHVHSLFLRSKKFKGRKSESLV